MTDFAAKARSRRIEALEGLESRKRLQGDVAGILPPRSRGVAEFKSLRASRNNNLFVM